MKIKSLYIYGTAILLVIALIVITSTDNSEVKNSIVNNPQATMPQDDIHKGLSNNQGAGPSKTDVKPEFWENLEKMGKVVEANPDPLGPEKDAALGGVTVAAPHFELRESIDLELDLVFAHLVLDRHLCLGCASHQDGGHQHQCDDHTTFHVRFLGRCPHLSFSFHKLIP